MEDNKFPNSICPGCHIQLEATKLFMDLIVQGQMKLRDMYRKQQEIFQKQERQKRQLQEALQSVNPNTTVQSYTIQTDESGEIQSFIQSKILWEILSNLYLLYSIIISQQKPNNVWYV